jgi:predicted negative regulator of RcsB-dependent stress response
MMLLIIVLGFLVPVLMVFGYSVWLGRKRRASTAFSDLVQRCAALKESAASDNDANDEEEINSVLTTARFFQDQNFRELSLSQVMSVYVAKGRDEEARALMSEVRDDGNRAQILKEIFGETA